MGWKKSEDEHTKARCSSDGKERLRGGGGEKGFGTDILGRGGDGGQQPEGGRLQLGGLLQTSGCVSGCMNGYARLQGAAGRHKAQGCLVPWLAGWFTAGTAEVADGIATAASGTRHCATARVV